MALWPRKDVVPTYIVHKDLEKEIKDNKVTWKSKVKQASMTKMRGHGKTSNK